MPNGTNSTSEAAAILGVNRATIARICKANGIGTLVNPRTRVLSDQDIETLKGLVRSERGNPNFGDPEHSRKAIQARWDAAPKKKAAVPKKASPAKRKPKA